MTYERPKFRSAYDPPVKVVFNTSGKCHVRQEFSRECDINRIMEKWQRTGVIEHRNTFQGQYGDFTAAPADYSEAMNSVLAAQEMFMTLPSTVRKRFGNDPGEFLSFVQDKANAEELVKLGLATAPEKAAEALVETSATPAHKKPKEAPTPPPASSESQSKE